MKRSRKNILKVFLVLSILSLATLFIILSKASMSAADGWVKSFSAILEFNEAKKTFIEGENLEIFLSDDKDSFPYPESRVFSIKDNTIYHGLDGGWKFRKLSQPEIDTLYNLASQINLTEIDSAYYKHLARYDYMFTLSVNDGHIGFSTSVYDSIIPKKIDELYKYLFLISEKEALNQFENTYFSNNDFYLQGLINSKGDTIVPSLETYHRIDKTILSTPKEKWTIQKTTHKPEYTVLIDYNDTAKRNIEIIGITNSNRLFFKLKDSLNYYSTKFDYNVSIYPLSGPVDLDSEVKFEKYKQLLEVK